MNPTPQYDVLQQVFSLGWLANVASDKTGTSAQLQADAAAAINRVLTNPAVIALIGTYETAWGPVVYQFPGGDGKPASNVADNLMYVAKTATATGVRYVVAIAYTNPISWFDWLVEDLSVSQMAPWPGAPGAMISAGANTGLGILQGMTSHGQSLTAFLQEAVQGAGAAVDVVTCGHSLGGTLSPLLALSLAQQQGQPSGWDQSRRAVVSAVPSAGFSPGNLAFANYYESVLGLRTTRLWNRIDMVPSSYNPDSVRHIPYLYYPYIVPNALVRLNCELSLAMAAASGQTYYQYNRNTPPLPGQVQLGVASFLFNLSSEVRSKLAARLEQAIATRFGLSSPAVAGLQGIIDAVMADFLSRWAGGAAGAISAARQTAVNFRSRLGTAAGRLGSALDDIIAEIEGMIVFYAEALVQHLVAYPQLLGVTEFVALMASGTSTPKSGDRPATIVDLSSRNAPTSASASTA